MSETMVVQEKPILFSGAMVRKIIEDLKTNTRRVMKPQPEEKPDGGFWWRCKSVEAMVDIGQPWDEEHWTAPILETSCPYGKPGDRLWVRETFCLQCNVEDEDPPFNDGRPLRRIEDDDCGICWYQPHYRATDPQPEITCPEDDKRHNCGSEDICAHPWRPSIHMPRWASRLTLEIVSVKVERVQDISEQDAIAEGCAPETVTEQDVADLQIMNVSPAIKQLGKILGLGQFTAKHDFSRLWDSINSKRDGGKYAWKKNPWVWCLTFKQVRA